MLVFAGHNEVPVPSSLTYSRAVTGAVDSKIGEAGQLDGESCQDCWESVSWIERIGKDMYANIPIAIVTNFHCVVASGW